MQKVKALLKQTEQFILKRTALFVLRGLHVLVQSAQPFHHLRVAVREEEAGLGV